MMHDYTDVDVGLITAVMTMNGVIKPICNKLNQWKHQGEVIKVISSIMGVKILHLKICATAMNTI